MKKISIGVWAGIFVSVLSLLLLFRSFSFEYEGDFGPGPGFFPVWLSGILFVLSLLYIYESAKGKQESEEKLPTGDALKNVLFILTCLIIFVISVSFLGFILTGALFLFILLYRQYRWYMNIGISLSISVFIFWLFSSVLSVTLPHGLFGF